MPEVEPIKQIMAAVVTKTNESKVGGGMPIFYTDHEEELANVAFLLSRILDGMVHDLENGTMIIVKH